MYLDEFFFSGGLSAAQILCSGISAKALVSHLQIWISSLQRFEDFEVTLSDPCKSQPCSFFHILILQASAQTLLQLLVPTTSLTTTALSSLSMDYKITAQQISTVSCHKEVLSNIIILYLEYIHTRIRCIAAPFNKRQGKWLKEC